MVRTIAQDLAFVNGLGRVLKSSVRIVFMGTPEFAVPVLKKLADSHEVVLVVTQPDRPSGRSGKPTPSPVKVAAALLGLPVIQPPSLRSSAVPEQLRAVAPEATVVAAFGQILSRDVLAIPRYGSLNVHASLLPRYRGASPITAAILNGDRETGVTIILMEPGLDTGPILAQRAEPIRDDDTAATLSTRLAELGAQLVVDVLPRWAGGVIEATRQVDALASYAPPLRKDQGAIDWRRPAVQICRQCRAYYPWPGCYTFWDGRMLKLLSVSAIEFGGQAKPGQVIVAHGNELAIITGHGGVLVQQLQMAGKRPMPGAKFLRGQRNIVGATLG